MADKKLRFDIEANSDEAKRALAELRREFDATMAALKGQQGDIALFKAAQQDAARLEVQIRKLAKAGGDTSALETTLASQRAALASQGAALRTAGINTSALSTEQAGLRVEAERVTRTFNSQKAQITSYNSGIRDGGAAAATASAQIAGYAAALLSVGAAAKGINAITSAGMQLQALNASLLFSTGSAEAAAESYAFVRAEAERLGLPLQVLGKQFGQMSAAANGTALAGDATRKIFTSVASAARVMGLQTFQVERALLAIQQMMSKGNVQAEELRGQLGEQIPGAMGIAARAMGVTTKELGDMMKAGELLSEDFLPKFAAELQRTVDPSLPTAVKTYAAEIERLKNTFTIFLQEIGKSGALEAISAQVVIVTKKLQEMSDAGELKPAIDQIVDALSLLATGLAEVAEWVAKNSSTLIHLAQAFVIFKAAQIGLGLAKTVAEFGGLDKAALGAATGLGKATLAFKAFAKATVAIAVITFTIDQLGKLVDAIREANKVEDELAHDRGVRNAEADIIIIQNADYAQAVTQTAAAVKAASDKEKAAYAASLKAALAYWEAVQQRETRNMGPTDAVPQAALDAAKQARVYRNALAEFDSISDARLKLEAKQSAEIKRIKEAETATIELAVEAQIDAVKKARDALRNSEKDLADIARKTRAFQQELADASKPQGDKSLLDVAGEVNQVNQLLAAGDSRGALDQIDKSRQGLLDLAKAGKEAPLFLEYFAKQFGQLAQQAGEQQKAAAEENVQEQERKLLTLQALAKDIENISVTADITAAEKEMQDLHRRTQAFYAANPLIVKVVTQKQDDIALGIEKAPKKAGGGLLTGPGTGTSDSILMWGSNREFMLRAEAVKKIGVSRLNYMNRTGKLPGYADGGLIGGAVGSLPRPAASGGGASTVLNLTLPGVGSFETRADAAVATSLQRALQMSALKHGRRT